MNHATIGTLMILMGGGLTLVAGFFGTFIYNTVKANHNPELLERLAKESQEEFVVLKTNLGLN